MFFEVGTRERSWRKTPKPFGCIADRNQNCSLDAKTDFFTQSFGIATFFRVMHQTFSYLPDLRHGFFSSQIDIFSSENKNSALMHLTHENLNSINSLNVFHPSVNKLAGGNSSGKVYLWTE